MAQNYFFINDNPLQKPTEEVFFQPKVPEWQQFSSKSKYQMRNDEIFHSRILQFPTDTPETNYMEFEDSSTERNDTITPSSPSSAYSRAENTDFLSAIPYARSSYTVKRKLNYEGVPKDVNNQNTKTYFPFEFVGHATRTSGDMESLTSDTKDNENVTMITGRALRRPDVNGIAFQTFNANQPKTPSLLNKPGGKARLKKRSNKQVALEKHVEQLRRKHAEFNWNVIEPQQKFGKFHENNFPVNDFDSQRVPTSPFLERYTPPSLYSVSEGPLNLAPWMERPGTSTNCAVRATYKNTANQQHIMEQSTFQERQSDIEQDLSENTCNETNNFHLYPY